MNNGLQDITSIRDYIIHDRKMIKAKNILLKSNNKELK